MYITNCRGILERLSEGGSGDSGEGVKEGEGGGGEGEEGGGEGEMPLAEKKPSVELFVDIEKLEVSIHVY